MPPTVLPDQRASLLSSDPFSGLLFFSDFMSLMEDILLWWLLLLSQAYFLSGEGDSSLLNLRRALEPSFGV